MRLTNTLFMAAWFSLLASSSYACAVDGVAAKTDTTISISWDVSDCKRLSAGHTFKVCWKNAANSGNACIEPVLYGDGETGITTITGLSPSTAYRIRTLWHQRSNWWDVTTRVVSTNPSPASAPYLLRYERETGQQYCVHFFWKVPPLPPTTLPFVPKVGVFHKTRFGGNWTADREIDVSGATFNSSTHEYTQDDCTFRNNKRYQATLFIYIPSKNQSSPVSNTIEWK